MNYIPELRKLLTDYKAFCHIAENLVSIDITERHENWSRKYPTGICIDEFGFPMGYIADNFAHAYAAALMKNIAFYEEWGEDFWDISHSERHACLAEGRQLYESYLVHNDLRLIRRNGQYLIDEIVYYAETNDIPAEEYERYKCLENAEVIELGGCYPLDYEYLAIKDDTMTFVYCGIWD